MYVCPTSAHRGFRYGYRRHKGNNFISESVLFCWQNLILWHDLTLLNINMSKKSTFAIFFLLKSLYYQWLFVSLQQQNSFASHQNCKRVIFIYRHMNQKPRTIQEQLCRLKEKGMVFNDEQKAISYLSRISYFRLKYYWVDMLDDNAGYFVDGANFDTVIDRYEFDKKLRNILLVQLKFWKLDCVQNS